MDENHFEHAEKLAEIERQQAIELARKRLQPDPRPDDWDGTCLDCEIEIPAERRAFGRVRCVLCQTLLDRKNKR